MNYYETYVLLRRSAFRSYWEKRILSEIGYLMELLYEKNSNATELIEQALDLLMRDYREQKQIDAETAKQAEEILRPLSTNAKDLTVLCVAHAHMDMNWMWGFQETVPMVLDTVRTMLTLMEEYPEFVFSQSQASVYHILEEYAPHLLEQVKKRVHEGRWEVTASMWVENDKNLSGGEALARHLLYTKKYLSKLLDIEEESLNLDYEPDTFGHSYNMPEILRNGGVTRYYHCRGFTGDAIYRWRSKSGAEVLVYNEPRWYGGQLVDAPWADGLPAFCEKYQINEAIFVYGVGDHGGGPTRMDIEQFQDMAKWPLYPVIRFGTYREFFDYLEERKEQFNIVEQELNYVFTGCYTSEARVKMANRIGEARLTDAEILGCMAKLGNHDYKNSGKLDKAWRRILFNQFHDILPGSCKIDSREYAMGEFQKAMARAGADGIQAMDAICDSISDDVWVSCSGDTAMGAGVGYGTNDQSKYGFTLAERGGGSVRHLVLFNTTQEVRTEPTEIVVWDWPGERGKIRITDLTGKEYPFQYLGGGNPQGDAFWGHSFDKFLVWMPIPPLGYKACRIEPAGLTTCWEDPAQVSWKGRGLKVDRLTDAPVCLENQNIKAVFDVKTMKLISLIRKSDGREFVAPEKPSCWFSLINEDSNAGMDGMAAWRVGRTTSSVDLNQTCSVKKEKLQTQGLHQELIYTVDTGDIVITTVVSLDEGMECLNFSLAVTWKVFGSQKDGIPQLRFMVPCGYEVEKYRYTVPFGVIDRIPMRQDVPAVGIGCAIPKENGSSLYLTSDCKYGFRGDEDGLSLNLLRGFFSPDPYPEIGEHVIRMAVGICESEEEELAQIAERFVHPVQVRSCKNILDAISGDQSFLGIEGGVLSAIKEAEDGRGFVIRVYNPSPKVKELKISMPNHHFEVCACDFLEHDLHEVHKIEENVYVYEMRENEVCSFRLIICHP